MMTRQLALKSSGATYGGVCELSGCHLFSINDAITEATYMEKYSSDLDVETTNADVKQNCLSSWASFRGCVRRLTLTKGPHVQSFDLSTAFDLQGVFPHSCPGTES
ncbi:hypothetical protein MJT46_003367 [Ovis ammon polii x Ovis aries]|nr:hypothetical protein MJT46_003367 [Ovis ammon polii x Ovis aries]